MRKEFGVSNGNGDSWRFQPKVEEAPSNEGAFLVPTTPHIGKPSGWGTLRVWVSAAGVSRYLQQKSHRLHRAVALFYWHKVPFGD